MVNMPNTGKEKKPKAKKNELLAKPKRPMSACKFVFAHLLLRHYFCGSRGWCCCSVCNNVVVDASVLSASGIKQANNPHHTNYYQSQEVGLGVVAVEL